MERLTMMSAALRVIWICASTALIAAATAPTASAGSSAITTPTHVRTIDTSRWAPPSPDPSGIVYVAARDTFVVVDGEVEETSIFRGANVFEAARNGRLIATASTLKFTTEPVAIGVVVDPDKHRFMIADDSQKLVFEIDPGGDGRLGSADDTHRSFSTTGYGNFDPEGLAFGEDRLYTVDGAGRGMVAIDSGPNGEFDGDDDTATRFPLAPLGIDDPEGIAYNSTTKTLYILDRKYKQVVETLLDGRLIRRIDLRSLNIVNPADLALAPGSNNPASMHLYVVARGVDNNVDPDENDGKIYEITLDAEEGHSVYMPLVTR